MSCRQRMSATWAWNTVTPWSSRAARMALASEGERGVIRRASECGGRGRGRQHRGSWALASRNQ